jgi:hypothetical protein
MSKRLADRAALGSRASADPGVLFVAVATSGVCRTRYLI